MSLRSRFLIAPIWPNSTAILHAGIVTTIADSACGYAAYSLMPPNSEVLSVEFKVNLLRPAKGEMFLAVAEVVKVRKDADGSSR